MPHVLHSVVLMHALALGAMMCCAAFGGQLLAGMEEDGEEPRALVVTMVLYSGRTNPRWTISDAGTIKRIRELLANGRPWESGDIRSRGLEFHGFVVEEAENRNVKDRPAWHVLDLATVETGKENPRIFDTEELFDLLWRDALRLFGD